MVEAEISRTPRLLTKSPFNRLTLEGVSTTIENGGLPVPVEIREKINATNASSKSESEKQAEIVTLLDEAESYFHQLGWLL